MSSKELAEQRGIELEITVCQNGVVNVRNPEYERGHTYSVMLDDDGSVSRCSCKGWKYHQHCYHADEVASRPIIVSSAAAASSTYNPVATDGGTDDDHSEDESEPEDSERGTTEVSSCIACTNLTTDDYCSDECRRRGPINEEPL